MTKTYEEINEKIRSGEAVVLTAEEVIDLVKEKGVEKAAEEVDVVTTGTYGAMCSSGAFLNFGHSDPPIRMTNIRLNGVEAYGGLAAVDTYIGATSLIDPPGKGYGGAHVIEDLIAGKSVHLQAWGPGTDCYVRKSIDTYVSLDDLNEAYLYNPRNMYQNYSVATNTSNRTLYTYMGKLMPHMKNATYSSAGELSPLMNDPHLDVIGMGTRIFLAGGEGYVAWQGTQFNTTAEEINGVPVKGSRTLAVMGDMKQMDPDYVRGLDITGYGISLAIGIGVPIPVLNLRHLACHRHRGPHPRPERGRDAQMRHIQRPDIRGDGRLQPALEQALHAEVQLRGAPLWDDRVPGQEDQDLVHVLPRRGQEGRRQTQGLDRARRVPAERACAETARGR